MRPPRSRRPRCSLVARVPDAAAIRGRRQRRRRRRRRRSAARSATTPEPGSLDELHRIIVPRAAPASPGLCHNGQFEPNLSTPALTYAYAGQPAGAREAGPAARRAGRSGRELPHRQAAQPRRVDADAARRRAAGRGGHRARSRRGSTTARCGGRAPTAARRSTTRRAGRRSPSSTPAATRLDSGGPFTVDAGDTLDAAPLGQRLRDRRRRTSRSAPSSCRPATAGSWCSSPGRRRSRRRAERVRPGRPDGIRRPAQPAVHCDHRRQRRPDRSGRRDRARCASAGLAFTDPGRLRRRLPEGGIAAFAISPATMEIE